MKKYIFLVFLILIYGLCSISSASSLTLPDGSKEYVANYNEGTVSVKDVVNDTLIKTITLARGMPYMDICARPRAMVLVQNGTKLYVTSSTSPGFVYVINTVTDTKIATIESGRCPMIVIASPDGQKVYVSNVDDIAVSAINTTTDTLITYICPGGNPYGLAISPDGKILYVANSNRTVSSIAAVDTTTYKVIKLYYLPESVNSNLLYIKLTGNVFKMSEYVTIDVSDTLYGETASVPEFPTIAAPIAAILGLVLIFGKKK
jgi:YVTN family beta-propeller protein